MLSILKELFKLPLGLEKIKSSENAFEKFCLVYKQLEIGTLVLDKGIWIFEYSEDFKNQYSIKPLIDFPDKMKIYKSLDLWPFFLSRIPGIGQPAVQELLKEENIDVTDEVALLKRFGKKTISNPFVLVPELA